MEQRDIEIFLTLAEELHFGRTAERLHVSTARVSQTIKKLERRVGAPLFERTSRQVALTPIGRRLDDDLRPAYRQIREGVDRAIAAARGVEGVLRVGFIGTAVGQFLHQAGEIFHARHPACQVQIREARYSDFLELLRPGTHSPGAPRWAWKTWPPTRSCGPVPYPTTWTRAWSPSKHPAASPSNAARTSAPSRRCSPSLAPAKAYSRCPPTRAATTRGRTSATSRSGTGGPGNAGSSAAPPQKPTGSAPSPKPSAISSPRAQIRWSTPMLCADA